MNNKQAAGKPAACYLLGKWVIQPLKIVKYNLADDGISKSAPILKFTMRGNFLMK